MHTIHFLFLGALTNIIYFQNVALCPVLFSNTFSGIKLRLLQLEQNHSCQMFFWSQKSMSKSVFVLKLKYQSTADIKVLLGWILTLLSCLFLCGFFSPFYSQTMLMTVQKMRSELAIRLMKPILTNYKQEVERWQKTGVNFRLCCTSGWFMTKDPAAADTNSALYTHWAYHSFS